MQRNRLLLLAAALGAAAVVAVVLIVVASGGGSKSSSPTTTQSTTSTSTGSGDGVTSSFAGLPQHGDTLGRPAAPATMLVFEDPQCPYCREFNINVLPSVVDQYVATGRLKIVFRGIEIIDKNSLVGLRAIYAAGEQNKLWNVAEEMYLRQGQERSGWITESLVTDVARAAGANPAKVKAAMQSKAVTDAMKQAATEANDLGVQGTPTFFVQRPPALPVQLQITSLDPSAFSSALEATLQ